MARVHDDNLPSCVTGVGCPGIYTLDCYCDEQSPHHAYNEFPHQWTDELGSRARAKARRFGWHLDYSRNRFLCPKCNPHSRKYLPKDSAS